MFPIRALYNSSRSLRVTTLKESRPSSDQTLSQTCEQKGGVEQSICTRMPSTKIEWILQNSYSYFDLQTYYNPMTMALKVYNKCMHCILKHQERPTLHNECIHSYWRISAIIERIVAVQTFQIVIIGIKKTDSILKTNNIFSGYLSHN